MKQELLFVFFISIFSNYFSKCNIILDQGWDVGKTGILYSGTFWQMDISKNLAQSLTTLMDEHVFSLKNNPYFGEGVFVSTFLTFKCLFEEGMLKIPYLNTFPNRLQEAFNQQYPNSGKFHVFNLVTPWQAITQKDFRSEDLTKMSSSSILAAGLIKRTIEYTKELVAFTHPELKDQEVQAKTKSFASIFWANGEILLEYTKFYIYLIAYLFTSIEVTYIIRTIAKRGVEKLLNKNPKKGVCGDLIGRIGPLFSGTMTVHFIKENIIDPLMFPLLLSELKKIHEGKGIPFTDEQRKKAKELFTNIYNNIGMKFPFFADYVLRQFAVYNNLGSKMLGLNFLQIGLIKLIEGHDLISIIFATKDGAYKNYVLLSSIPLVLASNISWASIITVPALATAFAMPLSWDAMKGVELLPS